MSEATQSHSDSVNNTAYPLLSLLLGPVCMLIFAWVPPPEGLNDAAWATIGLLLWMGIWWITEAVPIPVTSFLPLIVAPLLGIASMKETAAPYAHPLIFLFMGGFVLSLAMERWELHKRVALNTLLMIGAKPSAQIGGMMAVTGFLSMWMSNTATAVMMLPIGLSVIDMLRGGKLEAGGFANALLLGIAYSASIGGLATLIGTPPNALMAAYLNDNFDINIGFAEWMYVGVPLATGLMLFTWYTLTHVTHKVDRVTMDNPKHLFREQLRALGPMKRPEKLVLVVFVITAFAWMFRPLLADLLHLKLNDTVIAMAAACALFIIPVDKQSTRILTWNDTAKMPWGVLMLFGGGLSLAVLIKSSGLALAIAEQVELLQGMPTWIMIGAVVCVIVFLTEVTSNTATAAGFLPLLGPVALTLAGTPMMLVVPAAIAASCAFMMPVATPPNAIVFSSGHLKIKDMVSAGVMLNVFSILWVSLLTLTLARWLLNF
ncbi:DASS family sodium-coupled anion symporter [Teredinibacter turnerae]|uniref:SLC13 family permease n=1 Tax=Teredinibacter turnerae TaxID=2426 RepID=UPI00036C6D2F|nr:DASS family sodium-coupled anion symporter [Teredinibacter turnerae]